RRHMTSPICSFFFFQAEDGIRDRNVTGVQTCALPISSQEKASKVLAFEIEHMLSQKNISKDATGLIVGLGNWNVTPDALGPMTVEKTQVTSHLFNLSYETVAKGYRSVAAVTPGVMGV